MKLRGQREKSLSTEELRSVLYKKKVAGDLESYDKPKLMRLYKKISSIERKEETKTKRSVSKNQTKRSVKREEKKQEKPKRQSSKASILR